MQPMSRIIDLFRDEYMMSVVLVGSDEDWLDVQTVRGCLEIGGEVDESFIEKHPVIEGPASRLNLWTFIWAIDNNTSSSFP